MTTETKPKSTAERVLETVAEIADPDDDAGGLELAFSSVAMMMGPQLKEAIADMPEAELDETILGLARWFTQLRGDTSLRLVVVELPRRQDLPAGTRLHHLEQAEAATPKPGLPL